MTFCIFWSYSTEEDVLSSLFFFLHSESTSCQETRILEIWKQALMFTGFKLRAQAALNQASLTPHRTVTQTTQEVGEAREVSDSERQL